MMDLTTLTTLWIAVTTVVVVLAYVRMTLGLHDIARVRFGDPGVMGLEPGEMKISKRINRLDAIGIPLTVVSALLMLATLIVWAMETAGTR